MPKYQIILSSDEQISDDEFKVKISDLLYLKPYLLENMQLIEARNLEGIREELWKTKEEIKESNGTETRVEWDQKIETSFKEISKLFKLDS